MGTTISSELTRAFNLKPNVAQYYAANWDLQVNRMNGITLEQAEQYALNNDDVTYFFRVKDGTTMVLDGHGTFNSGDTVFFAGVPWYGSAVGLADSYEKVANSRGITLETDVPSGYGFTYLQASMIVPNYITPQGTLFLWPGFGPGGENYSPICNGVLQPVLTYGNSCAPNPGSIPSNQWWISGQYVNTDTTPGIPSQFKNCHGGDRMALNAGDLVTVTMEYNETTKTWLQTCEVNGNSVSYSISLEVNSLVQEQNRCYFVTEQPGGSSMNASFSIFNITVKNKQSYSSLAQNLLSVPQVTGVSINPNQKEFTIERVVIYSPIS